MVFPNDFRIVFLPHGFPEASPRNASIAAAQQHVGVKARAAPRHDTRHDTSERHDKFMATIMMTV